MYDNRSSRSFFKMGILKNFSIFAGKELLESRVSRVAGQKGFF